jgi:hypothetical protein
MKYCDHHGGGSEDVIQDFASPFELGEYLRKKMWPWHVDVNFNNLHAEKYIEDGDPVRGWKELWIASSTATLPEPVRSKATSVADHMAHCWGRAYLQMTARMAGA